MNFDIVMPLTLFLVTAVSLYLNPKTENKLKTSLEERKLGVWDAFLLVGLMVIMVAIMVYIPQLALIALFLFAYSTLLFTFSYLFSNKRWYVAILPPAMFVLLFAFLRDTTIWSLYLVDIYGIIFAVLITLYLAGLFTWRSTALFGAIITVADIILVLVTGWMVKAAQATSGLRLPVMISLPVFPLNSEISGMNLGLGDFFFTGLLAIQTYKQYGKRVAAVSAIAMAISFFVFEALLMTYQAVAFPGTVMIICGWLAVVVWKWLSIRKANSQNRK
jgi:hypothetical protein